MQKEKNTEQQFDRIVAHIKDIFGKKNRDYGSSTWLIWKMSTFTDQIFIKAKRIVTIADGEQKIGDTIEDELYAVINYSIMALMKNFHKTLTEKSNLETLFQSYNEEVIKTKELLQKKNHDYGEAWREMRLSSIYDFLLSRVLRIKMIEDNSGKTVASEGIDTNYRDMINYAIFALILMEENNS